MSTRTRREGWTLATWTGIGAIALALFGCGGVSDGIGNGGGGPALRVAAVKPTMSESSTITDGGGGALAVTLATAPNEQVVIAITCEDDSELEVVTKSLVFSAQNWDIPQPVLLSGVEDDEIDGSQAVEVKVAVSSEGTRDTTGYARTGSVSQQVTVLDNDQAAVALSSGSLSLNENGERKGFSVQLASVPNGTVALKLACADASEASLAPAQLLFTAENWNQALGVTVTGVDDFIIDGSQSFDVTVEVDAQATTDTTGYTALVAEQMPKLAVTVVDDDQPGVSVAPTALAPIAETGSATFEVRLNSVPDAQVAINVASLDTTEATVAPAQLLFNADNWNQPRLVSVSGVDDGIADGTQTLSVTLQIDVPNTSDTTGYAALGAISPVAVTVNDEMAGVTVIVGTAIFSEKGDAGSFLVALNSPPSAEVVLDVVSQDATEAVPDKARLTFTPTNWSSRQTVLLQAVDDLLVDGNQTFNITLNINKTLTRDATGYASLVDSAVPDVAITVLDDDKAAVTVMPTTLSLSEPGVGGSFQVRLNSQPTGTVRIRVESRDLSEASVSPAALLFDAGNWATQQTVSVSAVDDFLIDGAQTLLVAVDVDAAGTTDATGYKALPASEVADVTVTVGDNDAAGVTVSPQSLSFSEAGGSGVFDVRLDTIPNGTVVIDVISLDTSEATVDKKTLSFTHLNWSAPQRVTIAAVGDDVADGAQAVTVELNINAGQSSDSTGYKELAVADVAVTVTDDDAAGLSINPTQLVLGEAGGNTPVRVRLTSRPTGEVVLKLTSLDTSEVTVNRPSLTFGPLDWATEQQVIITAVNDQVADGGQQVQIMLDVDASGTLDASGYKTLASAAVAVTVTDDDAAGVTVTPTSLTLTEGGPDGSFSVRLTSQPTGDVQIAVVSLDTSEATADKALLTFDVVNWQTAQTVTVRPVDDAVADGVQQITIALDIDPSTTDTSGYKMLAVADVEVTLGDNDAAGVIVTSTALTLTEGGADGSFSVQLTSQPIGTVKIAVASLDTSEATLDKALLSFDTENWQTAQTVTVRPVDDAVADGAQQITIALDIDPSTTDTSGYKLLAVADVAVTLGDNDAAGVIVAPTTLTLTEGGADGSFSVQLTSQPIGTVKITVASLDTSEATLDKALLAFDAVNWQTAQTVRVNPVDDAAADGAQQLAITLDIDPTATTDTSGYQQLAVADVAVTLGDNDAASIGISDAYTTLSEASGEGSFRIRLNTEPFGAVVLRIESLDATELSVAPAQLVFDAENWQTLQSVTLTGVDDELADGDQQVLVRVAVDAASTDTTGYKQLAATDVEVTVQDNEAP